MTAAQPSNRSLPKEPTFGPLKLERQTNFCIDSAIDLLYSEVDCTAISPRLNVFSKQFLRLPETGQKVLLWLRDRNQVNLT